MLNVVEKIVFEIRTQIDFLCLSNGFGTLINELFLNLRGFSTAKTVHDNRRRREGSATTEILDFVF